MFSQANQQQTQTTDGVVARILSWGLATLVGGERSHHCATLAPRTPSLGVISVFECTLERIVHYSFTHCLCFVFYTTCESIVLRKAD